MQIVDGLVWQVEVEVEGGLITGKQLLGGVAAQTCLASSGDKYSGTVQYSAVQYTALLYGTD